MATPKNEWTIVSRVAEAIRRDALSMSDGDFLGLEDELVERYNVSRPTLRLAASVVAQEQLIAIKRGVGGGYFARSPDGKGVSQAAAMYLKSHDVSYEEIVHAMGPNRIEISRLAALSTDKDKRMELRAFLEREENVADEDVDHDRLRQTESELMTILSALGCNRVLGLFLETMIDLVIMTNVQRNIFKSQPVRIAAYRKQRHRLITAILQRDEELAELEARRLSALAGGYMTEDHEKPRNEQDRKPVGKKKTAAGRKASTKRKSVAKAKRPARKG